MSHKSLTCSPLGLCGQKNGVGNVILNAGEICGLWSPDQAGNRRFLSVRQDPLINKNLESTGTKGFFPLAPL